ncbi:MAG: hypothetical protein R3F14_15760 [Polyangiaceae bacterium]
MQRRRRVRLLRGRRGRHSSKARLPGEDKVVARGRKGTSVAAAVAGGHTFYAFLANQKTTEGVIVRAFAAVDDETPIPLSEEGSGATYVGLVGRGADVLAMYIDARTALTPVHARTLRAGARLERGADAVVFIGAGADGVAGAVGHAAQACAPLPPRRARRQGLRRRRHPRSTASPRTTCPLAGRTTPPP